MTLAAVSTALSISINLLVITLVVISLLIILVVMMQRPKQEGLGAAFGGGMTDQLLGAGTTSFLQKATVVLGILFFVLSLVLGILVGRSNKAQGLDTKAEVASEQSAAAVPDIADGIQIPQDGEEDELLKAIETASEAAAESVVEEPVVEEPVVEEPVVEEPVVEEPVVEEPVVEEPAATSETENEQVEAAEEPATDSTESE